MKFSWPQGRATSFRLTCIVLASLLCASCVSRPVNVTTRLIRCPHLIPSNLRTGPAATAAPEPDHTIGSWVNFGQVTEAGRLQENRDKLTLDQLYQNCDAENARINQPVLRRRFLGIF